MELGKEIKKAGKHPPPQLPVDPEIEAAEEAAKLAKSEALKLAKEKKIEERRKKMMSNSKRNKKKEKPRLSGPAKLSVEALIKWCSGRLVSEISLRAYFHEHKGATMKVDGQGKSVVHALASNKYVSKIGQLVLWFVRSHESHTELVGVLDADERTPLHYLAANPHASLKSIRTLLELYPDAVHMVDKDGKSPLMSAYEVQCTAPKSDEIEKVVNFLVRRSAKSDRKLENNPLHALLWAFSRQTISSGCCLFLSDRLLKENTQLLMSKNGHGVTPAAMASSSFSSDIQKLFRAAEREYTAPAIAPAYSVLAETGTAPSSPGSPKRRMKRWSSQPDFEKMKTEDPKQLLATRVFHALYVACDEKKKRPMDLFIEFDTDGSTTVDFDEFSKGVKGVGLKLSLRARRAVFASVDKEKTGQLDYLAVAKMIKKAGRYPPPPAEEGESLEPPKRDPNSPKKRRKKKKKLKIVMTTAQRAWNAVFNLMEHQRVKPIKLFHDIDESGDGTISPQELRDGLFRLLGLTLSEEDFKACLSICDNDHSGEISYREFARSVKYGDPRRIQSMAEKKAERERMASQGTTKVQKQDEVKQEVKKNKKRKKQKSGDELASANEGKDAPSAGEALLEGKGGGN
jgi:Ca2+-binding EF-hand superfamily protein